MHIPVRACWWEGSEGLFHPLLIQHLQWLSTLSLLAPISLPQVSATIHRPQTVLYPFDSQSQSAAEVNKHDQTSRGQAGHLEAVVLPRASGSNARAGPWVTSLSADGWGQGFCTSACHLVVRHQEKGGFGYGVVHEL